MGDSRAVNHFKVQRTIWRIFYKGMGSFLRKKIYTHLQNDANILLFTKFEFVDQLNHEDMDICRVNY